MNKRQAVLIGLSLLVLAGCSRSKKLEEQNAQQGRVIADLNAQVAELKDEMDEMKSGRAVGGSQAGVKRQYIK